MSHQISLPCDLGRLFALRLALRIQYLAGHGLQRFVVAKLWSKNGTGQVAAEVRTDNLLQSLWHHDKAPNGIGTFILVFWRVPQV